MDRIYFEVAMVMRGRVWMVGRLEIDEEWFEGGVHVAMLQTRTSGI
jgi:hypothetical protein